MFALKRCFLLFFLCLNMAWGQGLVPANKTDAKIIEDYLKLHQNFFKATCPGGTEEEFWKLDHRFRGDGHYIPLTLEDTLDRATIVKHLPELRKKLVWIDSMIEDLKKTESFGEILKELKKLEEEMNELLELKQKHYRSKNAAEKNKIAAQSKQKIPKFYEALKNFNQRISFLLSYNYPIDHLDLRTLYDQWKSSKEPAGRAQSNDIYFYRMIVQDGAQDPDHKRPDRFMRALIDTVYLELGKTTDDLLLEDLRYDLSSVFSLVKIQLNRGQRHLMRRLEEWRERTHRSILFYTSLLNNKAGSEDVTETADQLALKLVQARYVLKDHTLKKQGEVYRFWMKQDELMQALFAIETILYNEAGSIDGREGLERRDITQIVLNRHQDDFYSSLTPKDSIYDYLKLNNTEEIKKFPWLNLLFKEGEFSFTYFFITSSVRIYCPDMTRSGKSLRRQNLEIALELLRNPRPEFRALRYYSRHSMQGRIRMDSLWTDYVPIAERPGPVLSRQAALKTKYQAQQYRFLYGFDSPQNHSYQVLEIDQRPVVYSEKTGQFYLWRNPHYFKYFARPVK